MTGSPAEGGVEAAMRRLAATLAGAGPHDEGGLREIEAFVGGLGATATGDGRPRRGLGLDASTPGAPASAWLARRLSEACTVVEEVGRGFVVLTDGATVFALGDGKRGRMARWTASGRRDGAWSMGELAGATSDGWLDGAAMRDREEAKASELAKRMQELLRDVERAAPGGIVDSVKASMDGSHGRPGTLDHVAGACGEDLGLVMGIARHAMATVGAGRTWRKVGKGHPRLASSWVPGRWVVELRPEAGTSATLRAALRPGAVARVAAWLAADGRDDLASKVLGRWGGAGTEGEAA